MNTAVRQTLSRQKEPHSSEFNLAIPRNGCLAITHWSVEFGVHPVGLKGFLEIFTWDTRPGYTLHLLNSTEPSMAGLNLCSGPQTVNRLLPEG